MKPRKGIEKFSFFLYFPGFLFSSCSANKRGISATSRNKPDPREYQAGVNKTPERSDKRIKFLFDILNFIGKAK
jgi:hypothetical protein